MRRLLARLRRQTTDERGAVLVLVAVALPAFIAFGIFVVDVGNWWVHKRQAQIRADASALAGAMAFRFPGCNNNEVAAEAVRYSGGNKWDPSNMYGAASPEFNIPSWNVQDDANGGGNVSDPAKIHTAVNRPSPWVPDGYSGQRTEVYDEDLIGAPPPCTTKFVDVKMTESDLPWFFKFLPDNFVTEFIDAQARVTLKTLVGSKGMLPIGVEDVTPKKVHVWFFDENADPATATPLGEADLKPDGTLGNLSAWSNSVAVDGTAVTFSPRTDRIAVRVGMSGSETTDWSSAGVCSQSLVLCYGFGTPSGTPADGVARIRGVDTTGTGVRLGEVELVRGTCQDLGLPTGAQNGYFGLDCTTVTANVQLVGANPANGTLRGRITGSNPQVTFTKPTAANPRWTASFPLNQVDGAHKLDLEYVESGPCPSGKSNPCQWTNVQSSFKGSRARSGPLKMIQIDGFTPGDDGSYSMWDNNVPRCGAAQSCPYSFVVRVGLAGNIELAQPGDDPVSLRFFGGSRNQSLDCDPGVQGLDNEIAEGCRPGYVKNTGTPCPATASALWALPSPWNCVALQTGTNANAPARGLNLRVYGDQSPGNVCPGDGRNRYDQNGDGVPDYPSDDRRLLPLFLVPFGSFDGSGNEVVPVIGFASFYVTGWTSNGQGFRNPCKGDGDQFVPGTDNDNGSMSGYFVVRIESSETGEPGDTTCDVTSIGGCVAVMTK